MNDLEKEVREYLKETLPEYGKEIDLFCFDKIVYVSKSLGFAFWRFGKAWRQLKEEMKKIFVEIFIDRDL